MPEPPESRSGSTGLRHSPSPESFGAPALNPERSSRRPQGRSSNALAWRWSARRTRRPDQQETGRRPDLRIILRCQRRWRKPSPSGRPRPLCRGWGREPGLLDLPQSAQLRGQCHDPQTGEIVGGTGQFTAATGSFTGTVTASAVLARNPDGSCSDSQVPLHEVDMITSTGSLSFDDAYRRARRRRGRDPRSNGSRVIRRGGGSWAPRDHRVGSRPREGSRGGCERLRTCSPHL